MPSGAGARVVVVKVSETPPTVSVVLVAAELEALVTWRTATDWPAVTVPGAEVQGPPLMLYPPPETEMAAAALMPAMVIGADSTRVESATPVASAKAKASGTVSGTGITDTVTP